MNALRSGLVACLVTVALAATASTASASSKAQYGVQDDAWLQVGSTKMWSLDERLAMLDQLGVDVVRYTLRWDHIALSRPKNPANPDDPAYDWSPSDAEVSVGVRWTCPATASRAARTSWRVTGAERIADPSPYFLLRNWCFTPKQYL